MKQFVISGFTLIELLIVIAILGVLVTVVIVVIDPAERLAQSRDAGRISSVLQLGKAAQSYYTSNYIYPETATWDTNLTDSGYPDNFPVGIDYSLPTTTNCLTNVLPIEFPTYCYNLDTSGTNGALVYATLESKNNNSKCPGETAYFVYSTVDGHGGIICATAEPTPWEAGTVIYLN